MRRPYACPVCHGRKFVPAGFYSGLNSGTSTANEPCASCLATGIVWGDDGVEAAPPGEER